MKLLFCDRCQDLFKLTSTLRVCECGHTGGRYDADGRHAVVNGNGASLAIGNGSLHESLCRAQTLRKGFYPVMCWARRHEGEANPHTRVDTDLLCPSKEAS